MLNRVIHGTPDPEPWQASLLTIRPALLQSYRRHRVRHADYPAILKHSGSCVRGSVVSGLTDGDMYRLDIFEGSQYSRQKVKVQVLKDVGLNEAAHLDSADGDKKTEVVEEVDAETYVWEEGEATLEPNEWDFEEFKRDKMRAWMGLADDDDGVDGVEVDQGFADVDRAVADEERQEQERLKATRDPTGGRGANGHITQQLKNVAV